MPADRFVEVPPERLTRWVENFVDHHGAATVERTASGVMLRTADGSTAVLDLWWTPEQWPVPDGAGAWRAAAALSQVSMTAPPMLVVAVRRGGWAVGVVADGGERVGKAGRSYVQGRTAAGGSSQGRYSRRRANQARSLADDAADRVALVSSDRTLMTGVEHVVVAGDLPMVRRVLAAADVRLPEVGPLAVPDPRRLTLVDVAQRVRGVRIVVHNAVPPAPSS